MPNQYYLYFPYLLLLFISIVEFIVTHGENRKNYTHRWPSNLSLFLVGTGLSIAVPFSVIGSALLAQNKDIGLLSMLDMPGSVTFVLTLILLSLFKYVLHVLEHKIPFLWRFHKIHHSDDQLDASTTFRHHPLIVIFDLMLTCAFVLICGANTLAVIIHTIFVLVLSIVHHSKLLWPEQLNRALRRIIVTPQIHHIHHSSYQPETDSNYSSDTTIWDQVFGTYLEKPKGNAEDFTYGLAEFPSERAQNLDELIKAPFVKDESK